jgi:HAD superfamily hydrolase (TIGR01490 family)
VETRPVALFDFDGTLTRRDTLVPFLAALVGVAPLGLALAALAPTLAGYAFGRVPNDVAKQRLLARVVGGRAERELREAGTRFAAGALAGLLSAPGMALLDRHRRAGHDCVLASASLDLYLGPWAAGAGFVHCVASSLAVDAEGRVSGMLAGGNCFGVEKRRRVESWLADRRPAQVFAYSDSEHDRPMLALADEAFMIRGRKVRRVNLPPL